MKQVINGQIREIGPCDDLHYANLHGANLNYADLHGADLHGADLHCADLHYADLHGANLHGANLNYADLHYADLHGADLHGANLHGANLNYANLHGADLHGANLHCANLYGADLHCADLRSVEIARLNILPDGDIIGWKKCDNDVIVKLLIPKNSRRSNGTSRKCRAEFADVVDVIGGKFGQSVHDGRFIYRKGERVRADSFDDDRWNECSNGIHFFITREEAEAY